MGNKNSGRRPLVQEIRRHALIQTSYEITQAYLNHKDEPLKEKAQIAVGVVKTDLSKPIVIDQSQHTHMTKIEFKNKTDEEIIEFLTGRNAAKLT